MTRHVLYIVVAVVAVVVALVVLVGIGAITGYQEGGVSEPQKLSRT